MIERQYFAHFLDASMYGTRNYIRLGDDLEEYNIELNPEIESKKNIKGETSVTHKGYEPQSDVDDYYAVRGDALYSALENIANTRATGDKVKTRVLDVLFNDDGSVAWAYEEDVIVGVKSVGGDTAGYKIPFELHYAGNRKRANVSVNSSTGAVTVTSVYASTDYTWSSLSGDFVSGVTYYTRSGSGTTSSPYVYTTYAGTKETGTTYYYKNYGTATSV